MKHSRKALSLLTLTLCARGMGACLEAQARGDEWHQRGSSMTPSGGETPAEMRYVGIRYGKPPSISLYFDVRLRNMHSGARWFLLPRWLGEWREIGKSGGVNRAEIYEYGPEGAASVRLGEFYGNGGFTAVLLPAGADITLHRVAIRSMQDPRQAQRVPIPLVIAREVRIGDQAAESWFGGSALSAKTAEVEADQGRKFNTHSSANGGEIKVTLLDEESLTIEVPLTPPH